MKKDGKFIYIIFLMFFATLIALGNIVFKDFSKNFEQDKNDLVLEKEYQEIVRVQLGDIKPQTFRSYTNFLTSLEILKNGQLVFVGSEDGKVSAFDEKGKRVWYSNLGIGKISSLKLSLNDKILAVGEESPDGYFYLLNAQTGEVLFKYAVAKDLGTDIEKREFPAIINFSKVENGFFLAAVRKTVDEKRINHYISRCYQVDYLAKTIEKYPKNKNMDTTISKIVSDQKGQHVVFGTSNWKPSVEQQYLATLYKIKNKTWNVTIPAVKPYLHTTLKDNPSMSANGEYVATMTGDGRGFLLDKNGKIIWQKVLSRPQNINGVYINAVGLQSRVSSARVSNGKVIFVLGNTHIRSNYRLPTPIEDQNSNTVFVYNLKGELLFKTSVGEIGMIEDITVNDHFIALAVGRDVKNKKINGHGIYIIDTKNGKVKFKIPTNGPSQIVKASENNILATIEIPLQENNGNIIGKYALHVYKIN